MILSADLLYALIAHPQIPADRQRKLAALYARPLVDTMRLYGIDTLLRQQHFLAQVLHESARLRYTEELASGRAYEGRLDLGNTQRGDGVRYKGRGLIQLTGRANYTAYRDFLARESRPADVVAAPELVARLPLSADVAGWFWSVRAQINDEADRDDLCAVTRRVNGGLNGLEDRAQLLSRAKLILTEPLRLEPLPPEPL